MKCIRTVIILLALANLCFALESDTNSSTTNITGEISVEKKLPNIYLKNQTTNQQIIFFARRYDAVYFIAIPVTYYLTFNLLQQKNWNLYQNYNLDRADEFFLYFNTFFLPLIVAYFDYVYVKNYNSGVQKLENPFIPIQNKNFFYFELFRKEF